MSDRRANHPCRCANDDAGNLHPRVSCANRSCCQDPPESASGAFSERHGAGLSGRRGTVMICFSICLAFQRPPGETVDVSPERGISPDAPECSLQNSDKVPLCPLCPSDPGVTSAHVPATRWLWHRLDSGTPSWFTGS